MQKPSSLQAKQFQRKLFEGELKQRYNTGGKRQNRTQADEYVQDLTPVHHGSRVWQRKFIQQSVFLPAINKKQAFDYYGNESRFKSNIEQVQQPINTLQTEQQTMEYLNQCERIIQNLKKLTDQSQKKLGRKSRLKGRTNYLYQNNDKSYEANRKSSEKSTLLKRQSKQRSTDDDYYKFDKPDFNSKHNSRMSQKQRGPSFLANDQNENYKNYQQKTKRIINPGKNSTLAHTLSIRHQQFVEQQQQQQLLVPPKKFSTESNQFGLPQKSNRSRKRNINSRTQQNQKQELKSKAMNKMKQVKILKGATPKLKAYKYNKNPQEQVQNENDEYEKDDKQHLRQAQQIQDKAQQILKIAQKKQKYLIKYLNKANKGGFELHKRILEFSNKTGRTIRLKSKQDKNKQVSTDAKTQINKSNGQSNQQKVRVNSKMSNASEKSKQVKEEKVVASANKNKQVQNK